jgi:hypothetical protein
MRYRVWRIATTSLIKRLLLIRVKLLCKTLTPPRLHLSRVSTATFPIISSTHKSPMTKCFLRHHTHLINSQWKSRGCKWICRFHCWTSLIRETIYHVADKLWLLIAVMINCYLLSLLRKKMLSIEIIRKWYCNCSQKANWHITIQLIWSQQMIYFSHHFNNTSKNRNKCKRSQPQ